MKHTIEGKEVINYLQFLHETDKLEEVLPVMEVPENLVIPFINYKTNGIVSPLDTADNTGTLWSTTQVEKLSAMIKNNNHIDYIAKELNRSSSAIRNKAYYGLNYRFVNNKWTYKGDS